jgi:hypothetical protein
MWCSYDFQYLLTSGYLKLLTAYGRTVAVMIIQ